MLEKVNKGSFLSLFQVKEGNELIMFATVHANYRLCIRFLADLRRLKVALATTMNAFIVL
jgi:hypothetical protein